jgi:hypothetical protein
MCSQSGLRSLDQQSSYKYLGPDSVVFIAAQREQRCVGLVILHVYLTILPSSSIQPRRSHKRDRLANIYRITKRTHEASHIYHGSNHFVAIQAAQAHVHVLSWILVLSRGARKDWTICQDSHLFGSAIVVDDNNNKKRRHSFGQ